MICLFTSFSNKLAIAQDKTNLVAESNLAKLHEDKDFIAGSEDLRKRDYEKAASSFRKSLKVRGHTSGHIALGKALLGTAQSSEDPQTQSVFLEAISQF